MSVHHVSSRAFVRYFYLPAQNERHAEIIMVLNSEDEWVQVPMREEDVELHAFYTRPMSQKETEVHGASQTWKVFATWGELLQDHSKFKVNESALAQLLRHKAEYLLSEEVAA